MDQFLKVVKKSIQQNTADTYVELVIDLNLKKQFVPPPDPPQVELERLDGNSWKYHTLIQATKIHILTDVTPQIPVIAKGSISIQKKKQGCIISSILLYVKGTYTWIIKYISMQKICLNEKNPTKVGRTRQTRA